MKLRQKSNNRQELFDNTISHYNSTNRSTNNKFGENACLYRGSNNTACAIGREISDKLAKDLDSDMQNKINNFNTGVSSDYIFEKLPQRLQRMGQEFLYRMQNLHDLELNWGPNGLSDKGKVQAKQIAKEFKLNCEL